MDDAYLVGLSDEDLADWAHAVAQEIQRRRMAGRMASDGTLEALEAVLERDALERRSALRVVGSDD